MRPKKLKAKKNFVLPPHDEGDEFYPNGIFVFNITKLLVFIASHHDQFPVEYIDVKPLGDFSVLEEDTVNAANVANPIILAEISPGRFNVIDGNHRVAKARRLGIGKIPAYRVSADQHSAFLASERAYEEFIQYWNSKVEDLEP